MTSVPHEPDTPEPLDTVLDLAEDALDRGDPSGALDLCMQILDAAPEHPGALFVQAEAHRDLRLMHDAEQGYRQVIALTPDHAPSWSALGAVMFDSLRFDEAHAALSRSVRLDPENPEAYFWRAMLRERRHDFNGAARDYRRAHRIEPIGFPLPVELDEATIAAVVQSALSTLHPSIRSYLRQVAILLEDVPSEETLLHYDPPMPPGEILGYYSGVSMAERTLDNPWSNLPSAIVLYRCNLQRIASDREHLLEELRITVFHEVGHFLGLDEEDLKERGLD